MSTLVAAVPPHRTDGLPIGRGRTLALSVVALGLVMDLLDSTIVNVAIPSIRNGLHATSTEAQWINAGYALAFAMLLITGGRLGDAVGYRRTFLLGIAGFTAASLLSGLAWSVPVLIAARLLQGATAALLVPQALSLVQVMYPPKERGAATGLFGALGGLAASLGPIVGGLLIQSNIGGLDWRPIFLINVPVGIVAFIAGVRLLPAARSGLPLRLDLAGSALIALAAGLLVYPLIESQDTGWTPTLFALLGGSVAVLTLFWFRQVRQAAAGRTPLVLPSLFRLRTFRLGLLLNLVFEGVLIGFLFAFNLLLQIGLGYNVLTAALTGLPVAIGIAVSVAVGAPALVPRLGRYTLTVGSGVLVAGIAALLAPLVHQGAHLSGWLLTPGLLLIGLGLGLIMGMLLSVSLQEVPTSDAGSASGTLNAVAQVGGALGIAAIGSILLAPLATPGSTAFLARFELTMLLLTALIACCVVLGLRLPRRLDYLEE